MLENHLYVGDNLDILRRHLRDASIDLIYLDPPFNSKQSYRVSSNGTNSLSRAKAFDDTWRWDERAEKTYEQILERGGVEAEAMQAFRKLLGLNNMLAYLVMMTPRLIELRRVLKASGSIYLHCDPTASHYLKALMDVIFGAKNFRNEIIWHYMTGGACKEHYARKHDVLLFYTRSDQYRFYPERIKEPRSKKALSRARNPKSARISSDDITKLPTDVWQIPALNPMAVERLGYPTQKPSALLERIIQASSDPGDVVLDPFCGAGTTITAAHRLQRRWIGIDIADMAIDMTRKRLLDVFGEDVAIHDDL